MNILKKRIADLPMVYVTQELKLDGKRYLAAVSEARDGQAYIIDPATLEYAELWRGDRGVMNVIQIPGRNQLLAITRFYPVFQSREANICLLEPTENGFMADWKITPVINLPFCHRIGIVQNENGLFVIGCQLCRDKDFQEDWSKPGAIWMASIPQKAGEKWEPQEVFGGLTKNHGLFIEHDHQVYICCENGVLHFDMSRYQAGSRLLPRLISTTPSSDLWIDDGPEGKAVGVIEPFHGNTASVYQLTDCEYRKIVEFPIDFGHVMWMGKLFGRRAMIVGSRGGDRALDVIYWETGETIRIDGDIGPTQITVYEENGNVCILAANHGAGEVSLYQLSK